MSLATTVAAVAGFLTTAGTAVKAAVDSTHRSTPPFSPIDGGGGYTPVPPMPARSASAPTSQSAWPSWAPWAIGAAAVLLLLPKR